MKKNTTLQETIAKLNKNYGIHTVKELDELPEKEEVVSTGIIGLDIALGVGGIRKGALLKSMLLKAREKQPWRFRWRNSIRHRTCRYCT